MRPPCVVAGCGRESRTGMDGKYCPMHYYRLRRTGTLERLPRWRTHTEHSAGYVILHAPGHVLARSNKVYEHQAVLFDAIGYGPHRCHWCDSAINWKAGLEVDHVDRDRANNALANLVPSCHGCNSRRVYHRNQYSAA